MADLDSYLQSELDSINDMFQEFQTQDQQHNKRTKDEEQKILTKDVPEVVNEGPKVSGIEEVTERRLKESAEMERLYQEEMERLERERLEALERASAVQQQTLESDTALQNLEEVIMKGGRVNQSDVLCVVVILEQDMGIRACSCVWE
jgi:hypothetical protein